MAPSRYGLLGPLEVRTADRSIRPASTKQRVLLGVLLVDAGRLVSADRLIEELWGDELPADPSAALRTQVSRLRRVLGPAADALRTEAGGYRLCVDEGQLDTAEFEELLGRAGDVSGEAALELMDRAIGLWRGRALEEFADRDFAQATAVRLEELRAGCVEERARLLLSLERPDEAVASLEELLAAQPEREQARALLMRGLYAQGRHSEALECFRSWRRHLDELGLEPSPDIVRVEREILTHEPALDRAPAAAAPIPVPSSSFVGRDRDLDAVAELLDGARLVTLCGPGGVGKTRLALEIARRIADGYPDGVRLCELVGVRRGTSVGRAIATAVGVNERGHVHIEDQIVEHLAGRRMLLVLDNCEQVLAAVATIAKRLVEGTRGVDVLATSRERLSADGEHVWTVEPLDASGPDAPAVRLFRDRASAADPTFTIEDDGVVGSICARLDGLPLAIELAAGRLPGLTTAELAGRIDQRLRLLVQDSRPDPRHRSLRAVIDWSFERLSDPEQRVFERLGAFAGRFGSDAAATVAAAPEGLSADDTAALLLGLVDRSMVVAHREGEETRYALLESLRAYALDRLEERGELEDARDAHGRWAVDLAERASAGMTGPDERRWVGILEDHFDDLRAAHGWLVGRDVDMALRLSSALHWFALWHSKSEVFRWAEVGASAAVGGDPALVSATFGTAAQGACQRGEFAEAKEYALAALEAGRDLGPAGRRRATSSRAEVHLLTGELDEAARLFDKSYEHSLRAGDTPAAVWEIGSVALAFAYSGRPREAAVSASKTMEVAAGSESPSVRAFAEYVVGEVAADSDPPRAREHLARASHLATSVGSNLIAGLAEVTLASLIARHEDPVEALSYYEDVVLRWRQTMTWMPFSVTLRSVVELLARLRVFDDAAVLYGAVHSGRVGARPFGHDEEMLAKVGDVLLAELGEDAFAQRTDEGAELPVDLVAEHALRALSRARKGSSTEMPASAGARADKTFMFTDIVGSTALAQAMGDPAWDSTLSWHDATLRSLFAQHSGEEVKHTGDGFLVAFDDPRRAVTCAVAIQRTLARHRRLHGFAPDVRIGLHTADATRHGKDFTGAGVNIAARLCETAGGGEILATESSLTGIEGVNVSGPRPVRLKGVQKPVRVVTAAW